MLEVSMNYTYRVIIEPDEKNWLASAPALPGCHTYGKTIEDAQKNIGEAIEAYIYTLLEAGMPVPGDNSLQVLKTVNLPESRKNTRQVITRKAVKQLAHAYV
jgi:predicted RNase H-like HicB family nuclease